MQSLTAPPPPLPEVPTSIRVNVGKPLRSEYRSVQSSVPSCTVPLSEPRAREGAASPAGASLALTR
jgi:hypothetical protein